VAAQPFNIEVRHAAPRAVDASVKEFWLENPFDFERLKGFNLSMFERNRLYMNRGGNQFADVSFASAIDLDSDPRAVAVGDLNEDGAPDLIVRNVGGGPLRVFLNATAGASAVHIRLRGRRSNAGGIGARLWLEDAAGRVQYREHFPQNSLLAQNANETVFGIGNRPGPFQLRILWPSGAEQRVVVESGRHVLTEPSR